MKLWSDEINKDRSTKILHQRPRIKKLDEYSGEFIVCAYEYTVAMELNKKETYKESSMPGEASNTIGFLSNIEAADCRKQILEGKIFQVVKFLLDKTKNTKFYDTAIILHGNVKSDEEYEGIGVSDKEEKKKILLKTLELISKMTKNSSLTFTEEENEIK